MLILPTPKRELTAEEESAARFLMNSGVSVMINFSLTMSEGTKIKPRGEAYCVYDNWIKSTEKPISFEIEENQQNDLNQ